MQKIRVKIAICFLALLVVIPGNGAFASGFTVTPGIEYKKGVTKWNNRAQSIHTIQVDVARPEITVEALIPNPLTDLNPLTTILRRASTEDHQVVAGINASFFHTTGMHARSPAYLLAADNKVNTYGVISTGNHEYMSVPSAFGIDKNGRGQIGTFGYEASVVTPNGTQKITSINKARGSSEVILYTPSYSYESTRSNEVGMEIVLTNLSSSIEENYRLGTSVTAKVEKVVEYAEGGNSKIPKNGAVISIQGGSQAAAFGEIRAGDELTLSVDLTDPWQNADFVLASGPLLVQGGKVDMTINPNSSRAKSRHPRTAVAVNKDGTKVFLVTVDGRRTNSAGMTLTEFSNYLVSLGAHGALNLDGGGSTTMAVRGPGQQFPQVINSPSDNSQRYISAALGAVSSKVVEQLPPPEGGQLIHSFEKSSEWKASSARATTALRFDGSKAPLKDGNTGLTLSYDFTGYPTGTSASYAVAQQPIEMAAQPKALGLWVYGDGAGHWLRGTVTDRSGKDFVVDFTTESGLTWTGWKYVKAQIPASVQGPLSLKQIYIAETSSNKKNKGSIYFDRLVAEYGDDHKEKIFNDVSLDYWALDEISNAVDNGWINGFTNGTFQPENNLTRAHAAVLLSRALNLPTNSSPTGFNDVPTDHIYAKEIAAVNQAGIMTGKDGNKRFDPNGSLTRAQMAKMLVEAYSLKRGTQAVPLLIDVDQEFWAYDDIQILQANKITVVSDQKYRPNDNVTRAQFAAFMTRAQK